MSTTVSSQTLDNLESIDINAEDLNVKDNDNVKKQENDSGEDDDENNEEDDEDDEEDEDEEDDEENEEDEDEDEDEDDDDDDDDVNEQKVYKKIAKEHTNTNTLQLNAQDVSQEIENIDDEDEDSEEYYDEYEDDDTNDETYLQKFKNVQGKNYILESHPELISHNKQEIQLLSKVVRENGIIVDPLHKTLPFLTKYERARVLGQRTKQLEHGATPYIDVPTNIVDEFMIAKMELSQKKLPFIIKRPLPNGGCEYWRIIDLEVVMF
jgi:DNA-directed RNA polymerase subunit K/omega